MVEHSSAESVCSSHVMSNLVEGIDMVDTAAAAVVAAMSSVPVLPTVCDVSQDFVDFQEISMMMVDLFPKFAVLRTTFVFAVSDCFLWNQIWQN